MFVEIITTERDDPSVIIQRHTINWSNSRHRSNLERHMHWALNVGYAVHVASASQQ